MNGKSKLQDAYSEKRASYFSGARADYVDLLPASTTARILELGCGSGATGKLAREKGKVGQYIGIELFAPMAAIAAQQIDVVHQGNVDDVDLPYSAGYFDALIMSEVLEHLVDPIETLGRLVPLVKEGGLVLASSPNVSHWRIIARLMNGEFDYSDEGPMDRTHLRWFTPRSYAQMFSDAGVEVISCGPLAPLSPRIKLLSRVLGGRDHLFCTQINLIGRRRAA